MELTRVCCGILDQLTAVVQQLEDRDFDRPSTTLSDSTIGQHLRHTLEFFACLEHGFANGVVNYDQRERNEEIETNRRLALVRLEQIKNFLDQQRDNCSLNLVVAYDRGSEQSQRIPSNFYRELAYNVEHAVHHMALIKIGIREVAPYVHVPDGFGVAVSTLRHQDSLLLNS